jgi:hypothetical protein
VITLKHKIKKQEGTSAACQDLVLLDEAAGGGAGGKAAPAGVGVDAPDRVALQDGAVLPGACCVVLYVKESGAFDNLLFCFSVFLCEMLISWCLLQTCKSGYGKW